MMCVEGGIVTYLFNDLLRNCFHLLQFCDIAFIEGDVILKLISKGHGRELWKGTHSSR
jgi:hypothetical protein